MTFVMGVMWVLGGLMVGLLSFAGSGFFWVLGLSSDAGIVAVVIVAFLGSAVLIIGQRKIWPIIA